MSKDSWVIAGLGNPGENYRWTRHNVGFRVVEALVLQHNVSLREKDEAIVGSFSLEGREVFCLFPQTFMNESGRAIAPFLKYRQIPLKRLLVVSDDLDLPTGRIRLKPNGGSGGHHGLDSILVHLQDPGFPRLRIGIGKPASALEGARHVLASFTPEEGAKIEKAIQRSRDGIETLIMRGIDAAMNELNQDQE